jgi:hypothetical protein
MKKFALLTLMFLGSLAFAADTDPCKKCGKEACTETAHAEAKATDANAEGKAATCTPKEEGKSCCAKPAEKKEDNSKK